MDKVALSVVIITFNEEKNIERCLLSVKPIADEIVVVDSFSTDKTEEICMKHNARFISHKFEGHIEQKNWAITQAKHSFILSLDADEAIDETLKNSILQVKENKQFDGYSMNRLTNYCGHWVRHCGWYPDKKLRLWDSSKGQWTGVNPHDEYKMKNGAKIQHLPGDILHYSYYTANDHYKQIAYFTDIASKAYYAKGKRSNLILVFFSPVIKFLHSYFVKLGFLDGYTGFLICKRSAYATYMKYIKIMRLAKS